MVTLPFLTSGAPNSEMFGVVPKLQSAVVAQPFIVNNPKLKSLLEHPAGPFTSMCGPAQPYTSNSSSYAHWVCSSFLGSYCKMDDFSCKHS